MDMNDDEILRQLELSFGASGQDTSGFPTGWDGAGFWVDVLEQTAQLADLHVLHADQHVELLSDLDPEPADTHYPQGTGWDAVLIRDQSQGAHGLIGHTTLRPATILHGVYAGLDDQDLTSLTTAATSGGSAWGLSQDTQSGTSTLIDLIHEEDIRHVPGHFQMWRSALIQLLHLQAPVPEPRLSLADAIVTRGLEWAAHTLPLSPVPSDRPDVRIEVLVRRACLQLRYGILQALDSIATAAPTGSVPVDAITRLSRTANTSTLELTETTRTSRLTSGAALKVITESLTALRHLHWGDLSAPGFAEAIGVTDQPASWWGMNGLAQWFTCHLPDPGQLWVTFDHYLDGQAAELRRELQRLGAGHLPR